MTPKWLPGGLWAASGAEVAGKVAPGTLLGASWGAPGALLSRSWPLLGASGASPGGSRRGSGREVFFDDFLVARRAARKK